jgi:hypothetical protein
MADGDYFDLACIARATLQGGVEPGQKLPFGRYLRKACKRFDGAAARRALEADIGGSFDRVTSGQSRSQSRDGAA